MVTSLLVFLFVVPLCAGSLQEVLKGELAHVDDKLEQQLRMVIEVSSLQRRTRTLKDADVVALAQHICAAPNVTGLSEIASVARASLKASLAEPTADPALAVLARRSILACIVLHLISHKQETFDDEAEEHLADITRGFYGIHVNSVVQRGLMEYLHISKSGGTTFSAAAKHAKCAMAPGIGQLEDLGDFPRWINGTAFEELTDGNDIMWSYYSTEGRQGDGMGCRERFSHLSSQRYNYVSNEFTMHGGGGSMRSTHACPQVVNVVTLRDPDSRLVSHLHFMLARMKKRLVGRGGGHGDGHGDGDGDGDGDMYWDVFCPGNVSTWERVAPTVMDNYMTRSFVGEREFHAPVGDIGQQHVDVARRVLLQFDLVLDLDAGEEAGDLVLGQGLGWGVKMSEIHARTSASVYSKLNYTTSECHDDALLQALLARQGPDRHLYSFGRVLALLDKLHFAMARKLGLQPAPEEGRARGGDESCGLLSAGPGKPRRRARRRRRQLLRQ